MKQYLGFSCSQHDPAIAIVDENGAVVFAQANERALKNKQGWHAPPDAFGVIEHILKQCAAGDALSAHVSWSGMSLASTPLLRLVSRAVIAWSGAMPGAQSLAQVMRGWYFRHALYRAPASLGDLLLNLEIRLREREGFMTRLPKRGWNHHLCHAATACFSSPFDEAICVVMDGMGEGASTAIFAFRGGQLQRLDRPGRANLASLGIFYSQLCFAAGFDPLAGEEWKLMGLAAYGTLDEPLYHRLRGAVQVRGDHLALAPDYPAILASLLPYRTRTPRQNADLAFTAQKVFEEVLFAFLTGVHTRYGGDNLVLTGGCALNSSANGKVLAATPFRALHVPMAPGDDGNAIGAALLAWQADHPGQSLPRFSSPYLGSRIQQQTLDRVRQFGFRPCFEATDSDRMAEWVAERLAQGAIIGCMRGQAEFGPRALGNRSILADPRPVGIKDRLNAAVKFREEFRPFAPSILHEHGEAYFEDYAYSPYMERTLRWRPGMAPAGVCHEDGTGRLQSVTEAANPFYYRLISAFAHRTGVPILLNTSFNVMGRPMVHDVEDALGVFMTSDIDLLVLDDAVFSKPGRPQG